MSAQDKITSGFHEISCSSSTAFMSLYVRFVCYPFIEFTVFALVAFLRSMKMSVAFSTFT